MLNIKNRFIALEGTTFDYELEDGTMLHPSEWNGEVYAVVNGGIEDTYRPVYDEDENDNGGYDIIGFERW